MIGQSIKLGKYDWRVLDVQGENALVITEDIIELRKYHNCEAPITWADCDLRAYLNGEFLEAFEPCERSKIISVTNENPNNPWLGVDDAVWFYGEILGVGGRDTEDSIFLLGINEVCKYFGESADNLLYRGWQEHWVEGEHWLDDENNGKRMAKYNNQYCGWWLRSPGSRGNNAIYVIENGVIYVIGNDIDLARGVRPALWLRV
ncbi:MAG: DUF6273 domain-containing protein [Defluviitaleaceae bacterium]|nr:DUF6273 domain-containing protein [Defluviitaleaceae bacterium]